MPIFEYRCDECGHVSEFIEKFDQAPQTTCPQCQAEALKKLVSAGNFHLKGSGWYVTDYKDKNKDKDTNKDSKKDTNQKHSQPTQAEPSTHTASDRASKSESKATSTDSKSTSQDKEK